MGASWSSKVTSVTILSWVSPIEPQPQLVTSLVTPWIRKSRSLDWIGSICLSSGCQQLLQRTATSCLFIDLWKWSFFSHSTLLLLSPKTINNSAGVFWAVTHFWATFVGSFLTFGPNYCYGRVAVGRGIWLDPKISCTTWRIWRKQIHHNHATMIISLHLNWLRLIGNLWHQWHRHRQQLIRLAIPPSDSKTSLIKAHHNMFCFIPGNSKAIELESADNLNIFFPSSPFVWLVFQPLISVLTSFLIGAWQPSGLEPWPLLTANWKLIEYVAYLSRS